MPREENTIGQLNGWWQLGFKVALATYPVVIAWGTWVTHDTVKNTFARETSTIESRIHRLEQTYPRMQTQLAVMQSDIKYIRERVDLLGKP